MPLRIIGTWAVSHHDLVGHRVKQVVELVYATIREPLSTVNLPLAVARLLAVPREKLFKMVGAPNISGARFVCIFVFLFL